MSDQATHTPTEPPLCITCRIQPAYQDKTGRYRTLCANTRCSSRLRLCHRCDQTFDRGSPEAGNKFCARGCARSYSGLPTAKTAECNWCGATAPYYGYDPVKYICETCIKPIHHVLKPLSRHHVSIELRRHLRDHPYCQICKANLLETARWLNGQAQHSLAVDHDHDCCPGPTSCGNCIRGFLCQNCNHMIGQAHENPDTLRAGAAYLEDAERKATTKADQLATDEVPDEQPQ